MSIQEYWENQFPYTTTHVRGIDIKMPTVNSKASLIAKTLASREPELYDWVDTYFQENEILFDVGANFGQVSLYAALSLKVKSLAFEPAISTFYVLDRTIYINGQSKRIEAYNIAISNTFSITSIDLANRSAGKAIHSMKDNSPVSLENNLDSLFSNHRANTFNQPCISMNLDLFSEMRAVKPHHIKIDVDGLEFLILTGSTKCLKQAKTVMVEYIKGIKMHSLIKDFMESNGYLVNQSGSSQGNLLFINNS